MSIIETLHTLHNKYTLFSTDILPSLQHYLEMIGTYLNVTGLLKMNKNNLAYQLDNYILKNIPFDNIVPNLITIQIDRRMLPDETVESCMGEIAKTMDEIKKEISGFDYEITPYVSVNAGYVPLDSELVKTCNRVYERLFNKKAVNRDFTGCNDQNYMVNAGIPTLVFGPGTWNRPIQ